MMTDLNAKPFKLTQDQQEEIKKMVNNMTVEEKIGQLFFVIGQDEDTVNISDFITKYQPGGMMYRADTAKKIKREMQVAQSAAKVPMFMSANLESGGNGLISEGTWVGMPLQMAATDDTGSAYQLGYIAGSEAEMVGGNMSFSPIVDIDNNFHNPIMNTRTFGSDAERILRMSRAQIKGLQAANITPVAKHFPGDGVDERDQHLVSSINSLSADEWMSTYGEIYKQLIDDGVSSIMIAHILQPAWERKLKPTITDNELRPASSSSLLVDGLLRHVLGFNGLTITDATPMLGYNVALSRDELLPATINAGIDMILFNKNIDEDYNIIRQAVASGVITHERLDEAVLRIIGTKVSEGLMDVNKKLLKEPSEELNVPVIAHQETAREIAKKSVTLVKDRDQLLPMTPKKYPCIRLVVLGDSDDGGFKEGGQVTDKFKNKLETMGFEVQLFNHKQLDFHEVFEEGVEDLQQKFDLALYVANVETASNQTTTRLDWIHLMAADAPWFMKSIPTIFVSTANPYHLFDIPNVSTFINAYTGNDASIDAVLRKISGQEDFEGINPVDPFVGDFTTRL